MIRAERAGAAEWNGKARALETLDLEPALAAEEGWILVRARAAEHWVDWRSPRARAAESWVIIEAVGTV